MKDQINKTIADLQALASQLQKISDRLPGVEELEARAARAKADAAEARELQLVLPTLKAEFAQLQQDRGAADAGMADLRKTLDQALGASHGRYQI